MLNITDNAVEQSIPPILRLGFRPLFLSAGIIAVLAMGLWLLTLTGVVAFKPVGGSLWWHGHEMIFAFACAVIVGFLLTAVTNWTGQPGVRGGKLLLLWSVWLTGRVLLWGNFDWIARPVVALVDLAFLPVAAFLLAQPVLRVKQYRNLFFVPVLLLLAVCNGLTHLDGSLHHGGYAAVMLVTLVMTVMGGRVIPFFTANGTQTMRRDKIVWLELVSLASVWLLALSFIFGLHLKPDFRLALGLVFAVSGLANLIRFSRWRLLSTLKVPLLWSLQLSYLFIPITLLLLAMHFLFQQMLLATLIHGITVGAIGNMILAMMARVSLGHTGRTLQVAKSIPSVVAGLLLAAVIRLAALVLPNEYYLWSVIVSGLLWIIAFGVFSLIYWPILTSPRADGRPG